MSDTPNTENQDIFSVRPTPNSRRHRSRRYQEDMEYLAKIDELLDEIGDPERARRADVLTERAFPGVSEDEKTITGMYEPAPHHYPKGMKIYYPSMEQVWRRTAPASQVWHQQEQRHSDAGYLDVDRQDLGTNPKISKAEANLQRARKEKYDAIYYSSDTLNARDLAMAAQPPIPARDPTEPPFGEGYVHSAGIPIPNKGLTRKKLAKILKENFSRLPLSSLQRQHLKKEWSGKPYKNKGKPPIININQFFQYIIDRDYSTPDMGHYAPRNNLGFMALTGRSDSDFQLGEQSGIVSQRLSSGRKIIDSPEYWEFMDLYHANMEQQRSLNDQIRQSELARTLWGESLDEAIYRNEHGQERWD